MTAYFRALALTASPLTSLPPLQPKVQLMDHAHVEPQLDQHPPRKRRKRPYCNRIADEHATERIKHHQKLRGQLAAEEDARMPRRQRQQQPKKQPPAEID